MQDETVLAFFQELGFEEIDIEDGLTALSVELTLDGCYALVTNQEGGMPEILRQPFVFAWYTPEGAYQWSVVFKNAYVFKDTWSQGDTIEQKFDSVRKYWESKEGN